MAATRAELAVLIRRSGFGATIAELDAAEKAGWEATVSRLLSPSGSDPGLLATPSPKLTAPADYAGKEKRKDPKVRAALRVERVQLARWWLDRMTAVHEPWAEKRTWFWHGHFATSLEKVRLPAWMLAQNQLFRTSGGGPFTPLLRAVTTDPAMLIWLDGRTNRSGKANENYARECMELFALGHGHYTETDVRELARCCTGWVIEPAGTVALRQSRFDKGQKTLFGTAAPYTLEPALDVVVARPDCPRFLAARAWSRLVMPVGEDDPVLDPLVEALGDQRDLGKMWTALFAHPQFRSRETQTNLVKQPVEWVVGLLRALNRRASDLTTIMPALLSLGQIPFDPPTVGGWPENRAWLSTSAALVRTRVALAAVAGADLSLIADASRSARVEAVAHLLAIERWSAPSAEALTSAADRPAELVALAACSPEYLLA